MNRANLGSGGDYRPGWINVDVDPSADPDVVADISETPWTWAPRGGFDEVLMDNVLEHTTDHLAVLEELASWTVEGGVVVVRGPHPNSRGMWADPTHEAPFPPATFDHRLVDDLFYVESVSVDRVRFGRLLPDRAALWAADHVGHIVSGFEVVLRRTGVQP